MFPLSFVHRRIGSAVLGFVGGGPIGAAAGFVAGGGGGGGGGGRTIISRSVHPSGAVHTHFTGDTPHAGGTGCIAPAIRIGSSCVDPTSAFPGGDPFVTPAGSDRNGFGEAVVGMFGQAALEPMIVGGIMDHHGEMRPVRRCPRGTVLGTDNLCYNKIPNNLRKWPKAARPPITAGDAKCIRRAAAAKNRVQKLAKDVGLFAHKAPHRKRLKS